MNQLCCAANWTIDNDSCVDYAIAAWMKGKRLQRQDQRESKWQVITWQFRARGHVRFFHGFIMCFANEWIAEEPNRSVQWVAIDCQSVLSTGTTNERSCLRSVTYFSSEVAEIVLMMPKRFRHGSTDRTFISGHVRSVFLLMSARRQHMTRQLSWTFYDVCLLYLACCWYLSRLFLCWQISGTSRLRLIHLE